MSEVVEDERVTEDERVDLTRSINHKMNQVLTLDYGTKRERYLIEHVFPLLDTANGWGYSVEFDQETGRYFLEEVGEKWQRITHSHSSRYAKGLI